MTRTSFGAKVGAFVAASALMVSGAVALGTAAMADDAPGNSGNAPGQVNKPGNENTPPGQGEVKPNPENNPNPDKTDKPGAPNFEPGKKVWICHADANNGQGNNNLGKNGTGGEYGIGFNIIHIAEAAWLQNHDRLHENDRGPFATEAEARAACTPPTPQFCPDGVTPLPADGVCPTTQYCPDGTTVLPADGVCPTTQYCPDGVTVLPADGVCTTGGEEILPPEEVAAALAATAPEAVAAPAPATVGSKPKPAKVAAPAAATLPGAVPAGDGSGTPALPIWAMALLVVGALGAAASGSQLLGARK